MLGSDLAEALESAGLAEALITSGLAGPPTGAKGKEGLATVTNGNDYSTPL